jgi:hypothetical protein
MARPIPAERTAAPPEAPPRLAAVVALASPAAALPARLAELSAQVGPFGLPLAPGGFAAVIATEDPRAPWRYGRALPFPARILAPAPSPWTAAREAALSWLAESGAPGAVLLLPEEGAPIPPDLVFSLLAGLRPEAAGCVRRAGRACHAAIRPGFAASLPEGGGGPAAAALARQGERLASAASVPETPPPPRRPGWFARWRDRRADAA